MKKFKRSKVVGLASAVALVAAALVFTVASGVTGPTKTPKFILTSGTGFNITSTIYASPACSGTPALLYPGITRCAVFSVHNSLTVPITVLTITTGLDGSYTAPPAICAGSNLTLPTFSGSFTVVGGGSANSPGVPIALNDSGTNQDACENFTYHFVFSGTAQYTDATTTVLASSTNPSVSGHSVTFTATVTANNASSDPSLPSGTVNFYSCPSATNCSSPTLLGSGTLSSGQATYSTSTLQVGTTYVEAVYGGASTNFSGSTSNVITQVVTSSTVATTTVLTSAPNPSVFGKSVVFSATVATSSGTGTPTGTVNFYTCTSATNCIPPTSLGSGTLSSGKATYSTSTLPVGTTYVEAVYEGVTGSFSASTSNVVTQVVTIVATTTVLTSSPNPSGLGKPVTLTATVTKSSGSGTPTGTVSFYLGTPSGTHSFLGTGTMASGKATLTTSLLPAGTDSLYAVYGGDTNFATSTSPVISQVVASLPSRCTGKYTNWIFGNPASPNITGTNGNDFIYAFGGNFRVKDFNGNDCFFYAGDGNNWLSDGNGNDVALAGDGNNEITMGNGSDKIIMGNGTNTIGAGNGSDSVSVGNGSHNGVTLGNGTDSVTVGNGSHNGVALGSGTDVVTIQGGSYDQINAGAGNETIYLGAGTYNTFDGATHHSNLCHLPAPSSSWHGTVAAYYHDTITNCTVVTP